MQLFPVGPGSRAHRQAALAPEASQATRLARPLLAGALVALCCIQSPVLAQAARDQAQEPSPVPSATALPDLPRLAPLAHAEPDASALKELDRTLELLTSTDDRTRRNAALTLNDASPSMVEALRRRLLDVRASLDRGECARVLEEARKAGRQSLRKAADAEGGSKKGKPSKESKSEEGEAEGDWLEFLLDRPEVENPSWRSMVKALALTRMLTAIGTTAAVRELIQAYVSFGDLVRVDVQRQIAKLKDRAVPALIEARHHDAPSVQRWASKELDLLGRSIPGEAVGITDTQLLADVLRAYGRTRDLDAFRAVLSFANSDRLPLREAAREAVAALGEPGLWQLREAYTGLAGAKPPKEWTWDRVARELFVLYDQARMSEVVKLMEAGLEASRRQDWSGAVSSFDKVLSRAPLFDRRKEMVPAYAAQARSLQAKDPSAALAMLRKALRLDSVSPDPKLRAEVDALEAVLLTERGVPDKFLAERALEKDPSNELARRTVASLQDKAQAQASSSKRYFIAGGLSALTLALMGAIALWRPRRKTVAVPTPSTETEPSNSGAAPAPESAAVPEPLPTREPAAQASAGQPDDRPR